MSNPELQNTVIARADDAVIARVDVKDVDLVIVSIVDRDDIRQISVDKGDDY